MLLALALRHTALPAVFTAALAALPAPAAAQAPASAAEPRPGVRATMAITGGAPVMRPASVDTAPAALGDIDGDGYGDLALSDRPFTPADPRRARIVFGQSSHAGVDLTAASNRVRALPTGAAIGPPPSVTAAGDVNGDGIDDVLLTEIAVFDGAETQTVLFGGPRLRTAALADLIADGMALRSGTAKAAGDLNGDGRDDLYVRGDTGVSGILWGGTAASVVDLSNPGSSVLPLSNAPADATIIPTDVNGDRIGDLVVTRSASSATVVFGSRTWASTSIAAPGARGYVLDGATALLGVAGDFTGDRRDDLLVTGSGGSVSVVPGRSTPGTVTVSRTTAIQLINASAAGPNTVSVAAPVGDVTGDGRGDLVVSTPARAALVAGRAALGDLNASTQPAIAGLAPGQPAVWPVGDVDGDRRPDVITQAPSAFTLDGAPFLRDGLATIVSSGADLLAPQWLADRQLDIGGLTVSASRFRAGVGALTIQTQLTEGGRAELNAHLSDGRRVLVALTVRNGLSTTRWNGLIGGRPAPAGNFTGELRVTDAAGNRSAPRPLRFTITR